jgi:hypothetical protein
MHERIGPNCHLGASGSEWLKAAHRGGIGGSWAMGWERAWRQSKISREVEPSNHGQGSALPWRRAARVIVIDTLNGYLNAMPDERFLVLQMHELLSYLNQLGVVTILLLAQHGLMGPRKPRSISAI